mgnify:FL=1
MFGKYRGHDIALVAEMDPGYLRWCAMNLSLHGDVLSAIEAELGPMFPDEMAGIKYKTKILLDELAVIWPKYREWAKDYEDRPDGHLPD